MAVKLFNFITLLFSFSNIYRITLKILSVYTFYKSFYEQFSIICMIKLDI